MHDVSKNCPRLGFKPSFFIREREYPILVHKHGDDNAGVIDQSRIQNKHEKEKKKPSRFTSRQIVATLVRKNEETYQRT